MGILTLVKLQAITANPSVAPPFGATMFSGEINLVPQRETWNAGDLFMDYMEAQCCTPCSLIQEPLELGRLPGPPKAYSIHKTPS